MEALVTSINCYVFFVWDCYVKLFVTLDKPKVICNGVLVNLKNLSSCVTLGLIKCIQTIENDIFTKTSVCVDDIFGIRGNSDTRNLSNDEFFCVIQV